MTALKQLPPLALYIHIPWCVRKCPYCDFNSHQKQPQDLPVTEYVDSVIADIKHDRPMAQGRKIASIFIGGGTPSLLPNSAIGDIIQRVDRIIPIEKGAEITMEANPGTVEHHNFAELKATGVNRLSLGVQSFNKHHLEALGRIHSGQEAITAVKRAQDGGFDNLNLDLMHGLPQQTVANALHDLDTAIDLHPTHLSWYQLTVEPNTAFYSRPPTLPLEDTLVDIGEAGQARLHDAQFQQYEISAYARGGQGSKHNLNYWTFGDYLAIGAGAHGKITDLSTGEILRFNKTRMPEDYLDKTKSYTAQKTPISQENVASEFMMNAMRLTNGFARSLYEARTGHQIESLMPTLANLEGKGLLSVSSNHIVPTPLGRRFLNNILEAFV